MIQKTVVPQTNSTSPLTFLTLNCGTLNQLKQMHAHLLKINFSENPSVVAPLLSIAATSSNPDLFSYACTIFGQLRYRSTFLYNNMIRGYVQSNLAVDAIFCYKKMLKDGLIKNNYTFTPLIKACSMALHESRHMGVVVHGQIVRLGFCREPFIVSALIEFYSLNLDMETARTMFDEMPERDVVLWTTMIDGYGKVGDIENARGLFEEMPQKNVISWSAIMAAYSRISDFREVLSLFREMEELSVKPNESILVSVLTACAHTGALAQALWIHSYAKRCKFDSNPILATALVDAYSKCGCVELALSVFEGIGHKGSRAWNAIISGVAMNGDALKSLQLFDEMVLRGIQPTEATFVSALTACTHANLVDRGLSLFQNIDSVYGVEPKIEHYACIVDLLARSGRLEEAEKFVEEKMGRIGEGDGNVWGALLAACRIYGKVDIGKRVWRKLTNEGVPDYGTHVLSYNMYKEAGLEAEAESVRRLIGERRMKKIPGCSSIEVNGTVEEFFAGDLLHPKAQELCSISSHSEIILIFKENLLLSARGILCRSARCINGSDYHSPSHEGIKSGNPFTQDPWKTQKTIRVQIIVIKVVIFLNATRFFEKIAHIFSKMFHFAMLETEICA